jgi:hypothetical protein
MAWRGLWLGSLLLSAGFVACVTNHEALEKKPGGRGSSGSGGTLGSGGAPIHRGGSGGDGANGGGHADDEPPGDSLLTIVNGIVDAPSVAVCLAKVDSDGNVTPFGSPLTDAPLEYGQSLVLREVADVDLDTDGIEPFVIAGDLERIAGLDCNDAINLARTEEARSDAAGEGGAGQGGAAGDSSGGGTSPGGGNTSSGGTAASGGTLASGGATSGGGESSSGGSESSSGGSESSSGGNVPSSGGNAGEGGSDAHDGGSGGASPGPMPVRAGLRVRGLPAISAGTLNAGRSLVFVANGCMGGAAYSGKAAEQYCGVGYTSREPTVSAILVSLSREVSADHVALQVVHASLANAQVDLRARPPFPSTATGVGIASVQPGQVAPRPASIQNALFDLGSARKYQVSVESKSLVQYAQPWSSVLSQGSLSELENGKVYALVFNGPRADLPAVPNLWNAPTLTAIAVDPE